MRVARKMWCTFNIALARRLVTFKNANKFTIFVVLLSEAVNCDTHDI